MKPVLVFDVNETLLDVNAMGDQFQKLFGDAGVKREWFAQLLRLSMVVTLTDTYRDFKTLAGEALRVVADNHAIELSKDQQIATLSLITQLPAHSDVPVALDRLRSAGFTMVTLTNSPPATLAAQMAHAGLTEFFAELYSVDPTRRFKPHPAPYEMGARELGREPSELWMIAAHDWDVAGAMAFGYRGAFVSRPGQGYASGLTPPDLTGATLIEVADQLIEQYG